MYVCIGAIKAGDDGLDWDRKICPLCGACRIKIHLQWALCRRHVRTHSPWGLKSINAMSGRVALSIYLIDLITDNKQHAKLDVADET